MKSKSIILAFLFVVLSSFGCTTKENFDLNVKVAPQSTNSAISQAGMNKTAEVINKRLINFFGISQEKIKLDVTGNQILLTLHNVDTSKVHLITNVITANNKLEFWETYENSEVIGYLTKADNLLQAIRKPGTDLKDAKKPGTESTAKSSEKSNAFDTRKPLSDQNPLFRILGPRLTPMGETLPSCMVGLADGKDTSTVNRYLQMDTIKELFPNDLKFYWDSKPYKYDPSNLLYGLHAIKITRADGCPPLDGGAIVSAEAIAGSNKKDVKIRLTMDPESSKTWAKITRENISRCIAIVYNGYVRSYPRVQNEIFGGSTEITGNFTAEEANNLVNLLKSGELPFDIKIVDEKIIKVVETR